MILTLLASLQIVQTMPANFVEFASIHLLKDGGIKAVLCNRGPRKIRLWSPSNYEGMACISFLVTDARGVQTKFQPPVPPRAGGVPTAVIIEPGKKLELLPVDSSSFRVYGKLPSGSYQVRMVYENTLTGRAPVQGVWIGKVVSQAISLQL